jgi:hypothetical protein
LPKHLKSLLLVHHLSLFQLAEHTHVSLLQTIFLTLALCNAFEGFFQLLIELIVAVRLGSELAIELLTNVGNVKHFYLLGGQAVGFSHVEQKG